MTTKKQQTPSAKRLTSAFLEKNMSFDGSCNEKCPHCNEIISFGYSHIYHKWTLAWNIAKELGFGEAIQAAIEKELEEDEWNGIRNDKPYPFKDLAERINSLVFG